MCAVTLPTHVARLMPRIPRGFELTEVRRCGLGVTSHEVGFFARQGKRFALLPEVEAELGHERFEPTPAQLDSWQGVVEGYGMPADPNVYLREVTTPRRRVSVGPLLVQAFVIVERERDEVVAELEAEGFRLPTSDEWEWACGAGARTFFRWGDDCPADDHPHAPGFDLHRRPNAFGLTVAWDPYKPEVVAEPELLRGGDGGGAMCGGLSDFYGWIPLATAFTVTAGTEYWGDDWEHESDLTGLFVRRVVSL